MEADQIRHSLNKLAKALDAKMDIKHGVEAYATMTLFSQDNIPGAHLRLSWYRPPIAGKTEKEFKAATFMDAICAASEWIDVAETDAQIKQRQHDNLAAVLGLNPDGTFQVESGHDHCVDANQDALV